MSRGNTTTEISALTARHVVVQPLLELLFASGPVRLALGAHKATIGADEYLATGNAVEVEALAESADGAEGLAFTLNGLDAGIIALADGEPYRGRICNLYEARLDVDTYQPIAPPRVEWRGRITMMNIAESGGTVGVRVEAEHFDADARRPRVRTYSDEDQRLRWDDDRGYEYAEQTTEMSLVWPDKRAL